MVNLTDLSKSTRCFLLTKFCTFINNYDKHGFESLIISCQPLLWKRNLSNVLIEQCAEEALTEDKIEDMTLFYERLRYLMDDSHIYWHFYETQNGAASRKVHLIISNKFIQPSTFRAD